MHSDHSEYLRFSSKGRLQKAIESLAGIVTGISIDRNISGAEIGFLREWLRSLDDVKHFHPFNELIPVVMAALEDEILTEEESSDILWLCDKIRDADGLQKVITADMQRLHGILGGIIADGEISKLELEGLSNWLYRHEHLKTCWPYDEIDALIVGVLQDGKIDSEEHSMLMKFFTDFVHRGDDKVVHSGIYSDDDTIVGVCALDPNIRFEDSTFSLTGASGQFKREEFANLIIELGGEFSPNVTKKVDYLIVGAEGNPCWSFACYGRKVEAAVKLRKSGSKIQIIHENDFHDAILDRL